MLVGNDQNLTLFYNAETGEGSLPGVVDLLKRRKEPISIVEPPLLGRDRNGITLPDPSQMDLTIVELNDDSVPEIVPYQIEPSDFADVSCTATDLMAILQIASSVEEIISFFLFAKSPNHSFMRLFSGMSDYFVCWKDSDRQMVAGAEDRNSQLTIVCDFNETDRYYLSLFEDFLIDSQYVDKLYILGSPF